MSTANGKPRIVIYGTGQFGQYIARFAVEKGWKIVAAFNRAGDKVGQELGQLAGLGKDLGIVVQDCDQADYTALDADIAVVTTSDRLDVNMPAYERLMNAGLNVLCHGAESYYPQGSNPECYEKINALAKENNVTFTGGGIWDMSRIWAGILIAGPCTELNSLFHRSITNVELAGIHLMKACGVGMTQPEFEEQMVKISGMIGGLYKTIPHQVLSKLGYTVTRAEERREPVLFDEPLYCKLLERDLQPGECCGTRIIVEADTEEGVTVRAHIELRVCREGEGETMIWQLDGKPGAKITIERDDQAHMTAACLFNRVRDVIAADPGVQVLSELGPLKPTALEHA